MSNCPVHDLHCGRRLLQEADGMMTMLAEQEGIVFVGHASHNRCVCVAASVSSSCDEKCSSEQAGNFYAELSIRAVRKGYFRNVICLRFIAVLFA